MTASDASSDLAAMLFSALDSVQADRSLGVRLDALTTAQTRLWGHWGQAAGPSEIEKAALPVWMTLEGAVLAGEDLLWSGQTARVAAGRWMLTGRHGRDGVFGTASGAAVRARAAAELYLIDQRVVEGIVLLDTASVLRAIGQDLQDWARKRAGMVSASLPEPPQSGQPSTWAEAWGSLLNRGMRDGFGELEPSLAPGCVTDWPGRDPVHGPRAAVALWDRLRESIPDGEFVLVHQLGQTDALLPPRASVRWRLTGRHSGWGVFGAPTGVELTVTGISQVEFDAEGIRREVTVFDEAAVWAQIFAATGAHDG